MPFEIASNALSAWNLKPTLFGKFVEQSGKGDLQISPFGNMSSVGAKLQSGIFLKLI